MKVANVFALVLVLGMQVSLATAHDDKSTVLANACKTECPDARNDHHAHRCLKVMKKEGKAIEGACADALKEHETHEKKEKKH